MLRMKWTHYDRQLHAITNALLELAIVLDDETLAKVASDLKAIHAALERVRDILPEKKGEKL